MYERPFCFIWVVFQKGIEGHTYKPHSNNEKRTGITDKFKCYGIHALMHPYR